MNTYRSVHTSLLDPILRIRIIPDPQKWVDPISIFLYFFF